MKPAPTRHRNAMALRRSKAAWDKLSPQAQFVYLTKYCGRCFLFKTLCTCPGTIK